MVGIASRGIERVFRCFWMCGKWFEKKAQNTENVRKVRNKCAKVRKMQMSAEKCANNKENMKKIFWPMVLAIHEDSLSSQLKM